MYNSPTEPAIRGSKFTRHQVWSKVGPERNMWNTLNTLSRTTVAHRQAKHVALSQLRLNKMVRD